MVLSDFPRPFNNVTISQGAVSTAQHIFTVVLYPNDTELFLSFSQLQQLLIHHISPRFIMHQSTHQAPMANNQFTDPLINPY